jgi:ATP-dependent DNA helicase RecQ
MKLLPFYGEGYLALMLHRGGKSVCFQIPAMINEGICLVILVALMERSGSHSVASATSKLIALTGGIKSTKMIDLLDNCQFETINFLFLI